MAFLEKLLGKKKHVMITICRLDNTEKTSVIDYLVHGEHRQTIPTIGVNVNTINLPKLDLNI